MQGAFFCCFRLGMAGTSRDLGRDILGSEQLYARNIGLIFRTLNQESILSIFWGYLLPLQLYWIRWIQEARRGLYCRTPVKWFGRNSSVRWFGSWSASQSYTAKVRVTHRKSELQSYGPPKSESNRPKLWAKQVSESDFGSAAEKGLKAFLNPPKLYGFKFLRLFLLIPQGSQRAVL